MPLIPSTLSAELTGLFAGMIEADQPMNEKDFADKLALAITTYILTATVTTTVTGTSPSGPVSGVGTGSLS